MSLDSTTTTFLFLPTDDDEPGAARGFRTFTCGSFTSVAVVVVDDLLSCLLLDSLFLRGFLTTAVFLASLSSVAFSPPTLTVTLPFVDGNTCVG